MRFLPIVVLLAAPLQAQGLDIAVIGAADAATLADVAATLMADARISATTTYDARTTTPSLATLQGHDGAIVFLTYPNTYIDANLLGDNLGVYAAGGGGVVEAMRSGLGTSTLGGSWAVNYQISVPFSFVTFLGTYTLGTVLQPTHPIMAGVTTVSTGSSGWHSVLMSPSATRIAEWSTGNPMVLEHGTAANVVYLNALPFSTAISQEGLDMVGTDADVLLANCLAHVSPAAPPSGPTLAMATNCGGQSTATLSNMTPGGTVFVGWSFTQGAGVVPGGSCAGTPISLVNGNLAAILSADGNGGATLQANTPAGACGTVHVLALDVVTCTESNLVSL